MWTSLARRTIARRACGRRLLSDSSSSIKACVSPRNVSMSPKERAAVRAARKERAAQTKITATATSSSSSSASTASRKPLDARLVFGLGFGVPTALLAWGIYDPESPPARLADKIGLTGLVGGYAHEFAKPIRPKLLPDWSQMPNVPQDMEVPHTLVLDLENTLVSSTWDRKHGWRHAKRPGVDKFLLEMAQYYEIVLYSPSHQGVAEPVVASLDKNGCIMHHLFRDATWYKDGVYMKDLHSLNRNMNRIILLDDDDEAAALNPGNLIKVKPYTDGTDRDDDTLIRITPFLVEIAREGYQDIPELLKQFRGLDADGIADAYEERVRTSQQIQTRGVLGSLRKRRELPEPEMSPEPVSNRGAPAMLTSKDLVGAAPPLLDDGGGVIGWFRKRQKEQEEEPNRKIEKWNEIMMKKHLEKKTKA